MQRAVAAALPLALLVPEASAGAFRGNTSLVPAVNGICDSIHGVECSGDDIKDIGPVSTHEECCQACESTRGCHAWTWNWKYGKHCQLKSGCSNQRSGAQYHSGYTRGPSPSPVPPSPSPSPGPTPSNPLNIQPNPRRSDNYFLIIGDWGKQNYGGCQHKVADMMKSYVAKQKRMGKKALFVGAVGDNFYATGLSSDGRWKSTWSDVYGVNDPSSALHGIPWLAVLGNHDYGSADPGCACGQGCKQFNGAHRPAGTEHFWMPDYNWNYYIPGVDLEIVGLDTNSLDANGLGGNGCAGGAKKSCDQCGGINKISSFLKSKTAEGESLLEKRARETSAKTALIMQHYDPERYGNPGQKYKTSFESHNGGRAHVLSAYGHAHDQACQGSRSRGCDLILTGGGAGWNHGKYFGFTAVHLTDDGAYQTVLETPEVRILQSSCHFMGNATDFDLEEDILTV